MADTSKLFELESPLPEARLTNQATRLIGFPARYRRVRQDLRLLIDTAGLEAWSKRFYGTHVSLLDALIDRYPLVIFHGDVGTGKTATAEAMANQIATDFDKEAMLFKLSTRVRGEGNVGEMSSLINTAFEVVEREAGKAKHSFIVIDEADSLAASRSASQSHHEDKVAVNTLIQKVDEVRKYRGRVLVFLCTNRFDALDPAIVRRAAYVEEFRRPDEQERHELLRMDCEGLNLPASVITEIVKLTGSKGPHGIGYTFSDIRTRLLPEALAQAFPNRAITREDLIEAVAKIAPSPSIMATGVR